MVWYRICSSMCEKVRQIVSNWVHYEICYALLVAMSHLVCRLYDHALRTFLPMLPVASTESISLILYHQPNVVLDEKAEKASP